MKEAEKQLLLLVEYGVECVIVGSIAATLHGSTFPTRDLDVCYNNKGRSHEKAAWQS
jgi:hypothetical protein